MKRFCFAISGRQCGLIFFVMLLAMVAGFCGPALAGEAVPGSILTSFEKFSNGWMSRLAQVNRENSRDLKPESTANGRLIGRYINYGPDCAREVRTTDSKATPYVGIIRYAQKVMEKEGETPQKLKDHPGAPTSEIQVTEIFRYTGGRRVY